MFLSGALARTGRFVSGPILLMSFFLGCLWAQWLNYCLVLSWHLDLLHNPKKGRKSHFFQYETLKFEMNKDWPGELLEGAESHHGSHALTGWSKGCVEQNVADAGDMHHAVVVQVRWEWHPRVSTESDYKGNLPQHYLNDWRYPPSTFKNLTTVWSLRLGLGYNNNIYENTQLCVTLA